MPFSGPSSYLETIDEFIGHWTAFSTDAGPGSPGSSMGFKVYVG